MNTTITLGCINYLTKELCDCNIFKSFYQLHELQNALNASLDFEQSNFMTNLLVKHHEVLVFQRNQISLNDLLDSYTTKYPETTTTLSSNNKRKAITEQKLSEDPSMIDIKGKCVVANADNTYDSFICSFTNKDYIKVYLYIFDQNGMLGSASLLTTWALLDKPDIANNIQFSLLLRGGYAMYLSTSLSTSKQYLSYYFKYFEYETIKLISEMTFHWDFKDEYKTGNIIFEGYLNNYMYENEQILTNGSISYGGDEYSLNIYESTKLKNFQKNSLLGLAKGRYTCISWNKW